MKFNQISNTCPIDNSANFFWISVGTVILAIVLFLFQQRFQFSKTSLIPLILFCVFILKRSRSFLPDWTNSKDKIGEVEFVEKVIQINNTGNQIKDSEIDAIYFRYNFIRGRNFAAKDIIHNGLAELKLTIKSGDIKTLKFVIETEEQFDYLKTVFKKWYNQGIEIKEEFTNQKLKTICLNVNYQKTKGMQR